MEMDQQFRLLQQSAEASAYHYNQQNPNNGLRQPMADPMQDYCLNRSYSEEQEMMYDGPMGPRSMPRRSKRTIPDGEKDERYWEKRKRNNEAAKRSRENKRKLDFEMRSRLSALEEKNALQQRELEILKARLCIPVDQSILSAEQQADVIADLEKSISTKTCLNEELSMDLSKRRSSLPIKREPDEQSFMTYQMNHPLLSWQEQNMTSYTPDVLKRYDVRYMQPFRGHDVYQYSPQLERLPHSPPCISPVQAALSSSMNTINNNIVMNTSAGMLSGSSGSETCDEGPLNGLNQEMKSNENLRLQMNIEVAKLNSIESQME